MKIGIFTDAYVPQIGGVSTASQLIKEYVSKLGHEVYVITTTDKNAPEIEERVIRFPSLPFVSEKRIGLNLDPLKRKEIEDLHLDLIHTQTEYPMGILGKNLAARWNIPLVHTFHTLYDEWLQGQLGVNFFSSAVISATNLYLKSFLKEAEFLIVPSQKTVNFVEQYELEAPIQILPTGIELYKFHNAAESKECKEDLRKKLNIPEDAFVAVNIGRISEEKRINVLIDYMVDLVKEHKDVYFVAVGSGPRLEDYRQFAIDRNLDEKIKFIGQVPVDEVQNYYAMGDLFICASTSETQGLTYIEAMASGLPLLVWPDECLVGVLQEGENGLSFESRQEFSKNLLKIKEDKELHQKMRENALSSSKNFSVKEFAKKLANIYEQVVENF